MRVFLEKTDVALTLYLRRSSRFQNPDPSRVKIVEGDVLDAGALRDAMRAVRIVRLTVFVIEVFAPCPQ